MIIDNNRFFEAYEKIFTGGNYMNVNNSLIEIIIEYWNRKQVLSEFEKAILSTINTYNGKPFDRKGAEQKFIENNTNYPDIFVTISAAPGIEVKPFSQVSDIAVMNNLYMQIEAMCLKEQAIIVSRS